MCQGYGGVCEDIVVIHQHRVAGLQFSAYRYLHFKYHRIVYAESEVLVVQHSVEHELIPTPSVNLLDKWCKVLFIVAEDIYHLHSFRLEDSNTGGGEGFVDSSDYLVDYC